jgi:formylglycine-generating enzyme required for sulfatase activity
MPGNVWELCQNWFEGYPGGIVVDPIGPATGSRRVIRGGGWGYGAKFCRSAYRTTVNQDFAYDYAGFRVVLAPGRP